MAIKSTDASHQIATPIGLRCEDPPSPRRGQCDGQEQPESPHAYPADRRPTKEVLILDMATLVGDHGNHSIRVGLGTSRRRVIDHHPASRAKAGHVGILASRPDGRVGHRNLDVREPCSDHQPFDALPQRAIRAAACGRRRLAPRQSDRPLTQELSPARPLRRAARATAPEPA
jgi:hypothetical protein